jgi:predicted acylesterase/phospholipase RssA
MSQSKTEQQSTGELIDRARTVLAGDGADPKELIALAKQLNNRNAFGYARKLFNRALTMQDSHFSNDERLQYTQKHALTTYKDPALPADQRFYRAISILDKVDNLDETKNRETLGLAGSIYKRLWEVEGGRENLEKAYAYYRRGSLQEVDLHDSPYYTHINAAYLLDLLADLEERSLEKQNPLTDHLANESQATSPQSTERRTIADSIRMRREEAQYLREEIVANLATDKPNPQGVEYKRSYWVEVTLAEAYFGLGQYEDAKKCLERASTHANISGWQHFSTFEQMVKLSTLLESRERRELSSKIRKLNQEIKEYRSESESDKSKHEQIKNETKAANDEFEKRKRVRINCLNVLISKDQTKSTENSVTVPEGLLNNLYTGKVGLALSGGGFRASLFHIGVLAKLADMQVLNRIEAISCVSGGSIIGAQYFLELCRLYKVNRKSDQEITPGDYFEIVRNLEREFLEGVQKNIRTRVISNLFLNIRMIFSSYYSRTMRVGELYEKHIFSRVKDRADHKPRWLDELKITPVDEPATFNPRIDNWKRVNKIPIMILNATTLNTGHVWQFTASYMGEPPGSINTEIDAGYRLRRMYYSEAPSSYRNQDKAARRIRLGYAVAASSCVPGMFEPLSLPELYPDKTVQLVDGGVFDNQGIASLLEQDCSVLLVSDASGQMVVEDEPGKNAFDVIKRSSSISQERIRWAQHRELVARKSSGRLKGLMFIHLKKELGIEPQDWLDCPDPHDSTEDARPPELRGPIARYGIRKDLQQLLSAVRTDLDSFSEGEAYALMASGYLMTEYQFQDCREVFVDVTDEKRLHRGSWYFLDYQKTLNTPGLGEKLKSLLRVSSLSTFKIWRLSNWLKWGVNIVQVAATAALLIVLLKVVKDRQEIPAWLWNYELFSLSFAGGQWSIPPVQAGWVLTGLVVYFILRSFEAKVIKLANWQNTLFRFAAGVIFSTIGSLFAWTHIKIFDKLYLWWGKTHRLIEDPQDGNKNC